MFTPRATNDDLGREPADYDDLRRLAARYAANSLAGLSIINGPTQRAVTLTSEDLKAATAPGTPADLLRAIPALPAMLAHAQLVRNSSDESHHMLAATVDLGQRRIPILLVLRETTQGQCFLDRMLRKEQWERHRDLGGGVPAQEADVQGTGPPELDIFVGGANDDDDSHVKNYARDFQTKYGRNVRYFSWQDSDGILNAIRAAPPGTRVNVVGHSWGAHTAGFGIGRMAPTGIRADRFISIDPVGRLPIPTPFRGAVGSWVNVNAAPAETARSDRWAALGGQGGRFPVDQADLNYNVDASHGDFEGMMTAPGPTGVSPEQILLYGMPPPSNPRLDERFGGP
jgi:hypothetical protein